LHLWVCGWIFHW